MGKNIVTVGINGFYSTGSSAYIDLLYEFEEAQIYRHELKFFVHSDVGLHRLKIDLHINPSIDVLDNFVNNLLSNRDLVRCMKIKPDIEKSLYHYKNKLTPLVERYRRFYDYKSPLIKIKNSSVNNYTSFYTNSHYNIELGNFDEISKEFVRDVFTVLGIDCKSKDKNVVVLDQIFKTNNYGNPAYSFKYFENPLAIFVDRDPRDTYLYCKFFLKGKLPQFIPDDVDEFITDFLKRRQHIHSLKNRDDVLCCMFEELIFDTDNATKKVADFIGIKKRINKGKHFSPAQSRTSTRLTDVYTSCPDDVKIIEDKLTDYLFPFEKYEDIAPVGEIFYTSGREKFYG